MSAPCNRIVDSIARLRGSEAAVEIAMRLRDPYEESEALKAIAQVAASVGDGTTAIRLARRAQAAAQENSNLDHRLGVLAKLVPLLFNDLQAKELDELLKGAEEEVLLDVARRQANAGLTHRARVAMVRAWAAAIGQPALTLLAMTDPQILDDIRSGILAP